MHDSKHKTFEYFCIKCGVKIIAGIGHVKYPECKSGSSIVDYGNKPDFDNLTLGDGKFNWNRK